MIRLIMLTVTMACVGCSNTPTRSPSDAINRLVQPGKPQYPETARSRALLVGTWHGEAQTTDGQRRHWLVTRLEDGRFRIQFRTISAAGQVDDTTEAGDWGVAGPIYFSITRGWMYGDYLSEADPTDASLYDAYEIHALTEDSFTYRSVETGTVFTVRRVPASFELPLR